MKLGALALISGEKVEARLKSKSKFCNCIKEDHKVRLSSVCA